jgi:hypothetical protein
MLAGFRDDSKTYYRYNEAALLCCVLADNARREGGLLTTNKLSAASFMEVRPLLRLAVCCVHELLEGKAGELAAAV